ncbi:uncharacterized protein LOC106871247 [Octopus bimaculoides]|uniref:uncharacterized protein LOC106871247 n=1 Tax=Octopus bimaculoides TaxID=37653 RepID=UPI00071C9C45|nr:uncharacterized protein LOC106871247 [Octopus bimaculoides]|eukprot:XP_014773086.1 PREDICTED: uncharacterized protein LOC106871247 [Octopus bimaculoides]
MSSFKNNSIIHPDFCRVHKCNSENISFFDPCDCNVYHHCRSDGKIEMRTCNVTTGLVREDNMISYVKCILFGEIKLKACDENSPWSLCNVNRKFRKEKCRKIWPINMTEWNLNKIDRFLDKTVKQNDESTGNGVGILSPTLLAPILISILVLLLLMLFISLVILIKKHMKNWSKSRGVPAPENPDKSIALAERVQYEEVKIDFPRKCSIDMLRRPLPDFPSERDSTEVRYQRILSVFKRNDPGEKNGLNTGNNLASENTNSIYIPEEGQYNIVEAENNAEYKINSQVPD